MNRYKRVYFVVLYAHQKAISRFEDIKKKDGPSKLAHEFIADFGVIGNQAQLLIEDMKRIDPKKIQLIYVKQDRSITNPEVRSFLEKYNFYEGLSPKAPFGVGGLSSRVVFYETPPNSAPQLLWNQKSNKAGYFPLFQRFEDISHYDFSELIPPEEHVW